MSKPLPVAKLAKVRTIGGTRQPFSDHDSFEMARRLRKLEEAVTGWQVTHPHIGDGLRRILDGEE